MGAGAEAGDASAANVPDSPAEEEWTGTAAEDVTGLCAGTALFAPIFGDCLASDHAEDVPSATRVRGPTFLVGTDDAVEVGGLGGSDEGVCSASGSARNVDGVKAGAGVTVGGRAAVPELAWRGAAPVGSMIGIGWLALARLGIDLVEAGGEPARRDDALVGAGSGAVGTRETGAEVEPTGSVRAAWAETIDRALAPIVGPVSARRLNDGSRVAAVRLGDRERPVRTRSGCFPRAVSDSEDSWSGRDAMVDVEDAAGRAGWPAG